MSRQFLLGFPSCKTPERVEAMATCWNYSTLGSSGWEKVLSWRTSTGPGRWGAGSKDYPQSLIEEGFAL